MCVNKSVLTKQARAYEDICTGINPPYAGAKIKRSRSGTRSRSEDPGALLPILEGMTAGALLPRLPLRVTAIRHTILYLRILELCSPFSEGMTAGALLPRLPHTLPEDPGALLPILGGATAGAMLPRCCFGSLQRCDNPGSSWVAPRPVWPSSGGETA